MKPAAELTRLPDDDFTRSEATAQFIREKTELRPKVALVLGSGLGSFADALTEAVRIPYAEIPHFPLPSAEGHAGRLVIGKLGTVPVACMPTWYFRCAL